MKHIVSKLLVVLVVMLLFVTLCAPSVGAQQRVKVQIAFVIDGSGSMSEGHVDLFTPVIQGIARSLLNASLIPRNGSVEITVIQFGWGDGGADARVEVPATVITESSLRGVYDAVRGIQQGKGYTPTSQGIRLATQVLTGSSHFSEAEFTVINVATDGMPRDPVRFPENQYEGALEDALAASRDAKQAGVDELDCELLGFVWEDPIANRFFEEVVFPQPADWVPPAPMAPGFVRTIEEPEDFEVAVEEKLFIVLNPSPTPTLTPTNTPLPTSTWTPGPTPVFTATPRPTPTPDPTIPEPGSLALLASGLAGLTGWLGWSRLRRR